ncbi:conserved hypothetical protein [Xanthomonas phage OP2]|uniref:Uncharacterized protein n=1 Tax=Xanthomonas phage OP2 TaxID=331627 RepID=Q2NPC5_9CAUD|nr:hypothetical protein OP2_ORF7 [Xanthomonas phage OP2]BAE72771.1 conserved hypothetical protein [Xanthomonas phage OP2]
MARSSNRNASSMPTDATGYVTVACRLPAGMRLEGIPGVADGVLMLKGSNDDWALKMADEYGEAGLTSGVPAETWDYIESHPFYSQSKWLKNGVVFAAARVKDVIKEAQEVEDETTGFKGIDPTSLPARIEDSLLAESKRR